MKYRHAPLTLIAALLICFGLALSGCGKTKKVYFKTPTDGEEVTGQLIDGKVRVKVVMEVEGMTVAPAGEVVEGSGHHHIIIDKTVVKSGDPVPTDEQHIHYGKGQTVSEIALSPGEHTLTLQFANGAHQSYGEAMSQTIKVKVNGLQGAVSPPAGATPTTAGQATPTVK